MNNPTETSRTAPEGWRSVTPRIVVHNAPGLVDFICQVFGAQGKFEAAAPSVLSIGDSTVMVSEAGERTPALAFLYVYVRDADSVYGRALERGARSLEQPFHTPYGDRRCMFEDPWGNMWQAAVFGENERAA
jgi:PhnB protein